MRSHKELVAVSYTHLDVYKRQAYKCYMARLADGFSEDELETAVKRYADECKKNHTEERYIKLGATFLGPNTPFVDYLGGKMCIRDSS